MKEETISKAKELILLSNQTEPRHWFMSPMMKSDFSDSVEVCTIGPFETEDPHYEDTLAEFIGANSLAEENAKFTVFAKNNAADIASNFLEAVQQLKELKAELDFKNSLLSNIKGRINSEMSLEPIKKLLENFDDN